MERKTTKSDEKATSDERRITTGHYVYVHYDISDNAKRDACREELQEESFVRMSQSVYAAIYSKENHDAANRVVRKYRLRDTLITTPYIPTEEQRRQVMLRFEKAFTEHFADIDDSISFVEEALSRDRLYTDKKTGAVRPYTKEQLTGRVKDIEDDIRWLEGVLAKRKSREPNSNLLRYELHLRQSQTYLDKLAKSVAASRNTKLEDYSGK